MLITPTDLLNPNKETLKTIAQARAHERKIIREFNLIAQSKLRGETVEDRVATQLRNQVRETPDGQPTGGDQAVVHRLTRFDRKKLYAAEPTKAVNASDVDRAEINESIFDDQVRGRIREFDFDD